MWNESGVTGAGGFINSPSQFASPSGDQEKKTTRRAQNIVPVTVRQILNSPDEVFMIGNIEVHLVTLIGIVKSIEVSSTKATYALEDDTGTLNAVLWLDGPMPDNGVVENTYCRLYGSLRTHQGIRNIMIFKISPLEDLSELTTHILEVIEVSLSAEQMSNNETTVQESSRGTTHQALSNSLMHINVGGNQTPSLMQNERLSQAQQWVLDIVKNSTSNVGASKTQMAATLSTKLSMKEINDIVEFLSSEGHIYSTVDEEHYAYTS